MEALRNAIAVFREKHKNSLPTNFIIYRDGVGDAMRDQVIGSEIQRYQEAIADIYRSSKFQPKITLIFVNKRIT